MVAFSQGIDVRVDIVDICPLDRGEYVGEQY